MLTFLRAVVVAVACLMSAAAGAQPPADSLRRHVLASTVLGEERGVLVRVPAAYAATSRRYPVLYLTDGEAHIAHTSTTVEFLARNGRMPEMIVVGISNTDRTRDLTPTRVTRPAFGRRDGFPTSGGADRFLSFIESELVPFIEREYRTEPYRVFAGHSFGGLFALHAFYTKPDLFNATIAVSPTLAWDDGLPIARTREFLAGRRELKRTLYVTIGDEGAELDRALARFEEVVQQAKVAKLAFAAERMREDDHGSLVLVSHHDGLRRVFDGWAPRVDRATNAFTGGLAGVKAHYAKLSDRLAWTVIPPEALVNNLGYAAMAAGRHDDALEIFRFNVASYPDSANVHDSLGEGLEAAGRLADAVSSYQKAVALGSTNGDPALPVYKEHLDKARAK